MKISVVILLSLTVLLTMEEIYLPIASHINHFGASAYIKPRHTDPEDTIKYLREQIVGRKEKYIGKELNVLINDLAIQPCFSLYNVGGFDGNMNYKISTGIYLYYFKGDVTEKRLRRHVAGGVLKIYWQTPYNVDSVVNFERNNERRWNKAAVEFYGTRIVKDLEVQ